MECAFDRISDSCLLSRRKDFTSEAFIEFIEALGLLQQIKSARTIVVKPNFAGGSSVPVESHAVTDPSLLHNVVRGIRAANQSAIIYIAESDSAGRGFAFLKFSNMGIDQWRMENVKLLDLSRDRLCEVNLSAPRYFKSDSERLFLSETLVNSDFVISLANLKTHAVTKYTGACKNLFGVLPKEDKYIYHTSLDDVIFDLVKAVKPALSIVDGFRSMEQNGPIVGNPINLGLRIIGSDPVLVDIVGCHVIRLRHNRVKHLKLLSHGLSLPELNEVPTFKIQYRVPTLAFSNYVGLKMQHTGYSLFMYGHRVHSANTIFILLLMAIRPILLMFVDLQTLKKLKEKIFK